MKLKEKVNEQEELKNWIVEEFENIKEEEFNLQELFKFNNATFATIIFEINELKKLYKLKNKSMKNNKKAIYIGASLHKRIKQYESRIRIDGRKLFLSYFDSPTDANLAYRIAQGIKREGTFATEFKSDPKLLREYIKREINK